MNKKILLSLGASLSIIPLAVIAACSSTSTDDILDDQVKLFNSPITTTDKSADPQVVVNEITEATSQDAKLIVVKKYIASVPKLASGYKFDIVSAEVRSGALSAVDVSIKIYKSDSPSASRNATLKIEGFEMEVIESDIEAEARKFLATTTKTPTTCAYTTVDNINNLENDNDKFHTINLIAKVPSLSSNFDYRVNGANVNSVVKTTVDVDITIFNKLVPTETKDIVYEITGFKVSNLEIEAEKFEDTVTKTPNITSTQAVEGIRNASTPEEKKAALEDIVVIPELEVGFDFGVNNAIIDKDDETSILVVVQLFEVDFPAKTRTTVYSVSGFQLPEAIITLEDQVKLFEDIRDTHRPSSDSLEAAQDINNASFSNKLPVLKSYVDVPLLADKFDLQVISATDMGGNSEAITVQIRIFRIDEIEGEDNEAIVELIVQGFVNIGQNELDAETSRFVSSPTKTTDLSAIRTAANINAISEADRIHTLNLIADLPTLSKGFGLKVNSASVNVNLKSTLDISLSVFSLRDDRINKNFIYEVSNFQISDIETEVEKFVDTDTISSDISSVGIAQEIQSAATQEAKRVALSKVTTLPLIEESFDFTINQVVVDKDDRTKILVVISVYKKTNQNLARTIAYKISGLKSSTVEIEAAKFTSTITKKDVPASTYISQFESASTPDNRLEILKEIAE
ncbi:MAG: hypothetical protein ACRCXE_01115, partial [Metamycoplasmataceae bacterium]